MRAILRFLIPTLLASTLTVWSSQGVARADLVNVYIQGLAGLSGASLKEINVGEGTSSLGGVLGGEVGAKFLFLNGYAGIDDYLSRGAVTRFVLAFTGGVGLGGFHLSGRAGMGLIIETGGVFDNVMVAPDTTRTGATARAGVALDYGLSYGLYVGAGLDGEFYALKASGGSDTDFHSGADILLSLHVGFSLGL